MRQRHYITVTDEGLQGLAEQLSNRIECLQRKSGHGWAYPGTSLICIAIKQALGVPVPESLLQDLQEYLPLWVEEEEVEVSSDYTATLTVEGGKPVMKIGCQTLDDSTVQRLHDSFERYKKKVDL